MTGPRWWDPGRRPGRRRAARVRSGSLRLALPGDEEVAGVGPGAELGGPRVLRGLGAAQHEGVALQPVDALADPVAAGVREGHVDVPGLLGRVQGDAHLVLHVLDADD